MVWSIPTNNRIATLGKANAEDAISRLIVGALQDGDVALRRRFFDALGLTLDKPPTETCAWVCGTQIAMKGGRADIVLAWRSADGAVGQLVLIEQKLHASEHDTQTERYASAESQAQLRAAAAEAFAPAGTPGEWLPTKFVYLTLFEDEPANEHFKLCVRRHPALLPWLDYVSKAALPCSDLAGDWAALLRRFEGRSRDALELPLAHVMGADGESDWLDARYNVFVAFSKTIENASGLEYHGSYGTAAPGRSWFGSHYSKTGWHPGADRLDEVDGWEAHFAPAHDYWVHTQIHWSELEFDVTTPSLILKLNFETLPYATQKRFEQIVTDVDIANAYRARREQVGADEILRNALRAEGWSVRGYWNQVATIKFVFPPDAKWDAVVGGAAERLQRIVAPVDEAVRRLRLDVRERPASRP